MPYLPNLSTVQPNCRFHPVVSELTLPVPPLHDASQFCLHSAALGVAPVSTLLNSVRICLRKIGFLPMHDPGKLPPRRLYCYYSSITAMVTKHSQQYDHWIALSHSCTHHLNTSCHWLHSFTCPSLMAPHARRLTVAIWLVASAYRSNTRRRRHGRLT